MKAQMMVPRVMITINTTLHLHEKHPAVSALLLSSAAIEHVPSLPLLRFVISIPAVMAASATLRTETSGTGLVVNSA